jgi:hypothetical protein
MNRSKLFRLAMALGFLGLGRGAAAANTSYDLERLWLDPSARGSLVLGDGETLPAQGARIGAGVGWEGSPLVLRNPGLRGGGLFSDGHRIGDVAKDRFTLRLVAALGITDHLEFGARVPLLLSQDGSNLSANGFPPLRKSDIQALSAMVRYGLTRQASGAPISTAIAAEVGFPIDHAGDVNGGPSNGYPGVIPRFEIGKR